MQASALALTGPNALRGSNNKEPSPRRSPARGYVGERIASFRRFDCFSRRVLSPAPCGFNRREYDGKRSQGELEIDFRRHAAGVPQKDVALHAERERGTRRGNRAAEHSAPRGVADDGVRFENEYNEVFCRYGERVKRPAPKVLDADGAEIRAGDTVWHAEDGREGTVKQIVRAHDAQWNDTACVCVAFNGSSRDDYILPGNLAHRAPVLAADGKPLRVGETVYTTHYGHVKCTVLAIEWVVDGYLVEVENEGGHKFRQTLDEFTHAKPEQDTWERIEEDAKLWPGEYAQGHPGWAEHDGRLSEFMALDLVRRCRALAERGEL